MNKPSKLDLYPNIKEYLENINKTNSSINLNEFKNIIFDISNELDISTEAIEIILKIYFQEIENEMFNGNIVHTTNLGNLSICGPKMNNSKRNVRFKFDLSPRLKRFINKKYGFKK